MKHSINEVELSEARAGQNMMSLCYEIDALRNSLMIMKAERDELQRKYSALLNETVRESGRTTAAILMLALNGRLKASDL